jgi:hypothetical protein
MSHEIEPFRSLSNQFESILNRPIGILALSFSGSNLKTVLDVLISQNGTERFNKQLAEGMRLTG